jgi:hypothetical protein
MFRAMDEGYRGLLGWTLRHKPVVGALAVLSLVGTIQIAGIMSAGRGALEYARVSDMQVRYMPVDLRCASPSTGSGRRMKGLPRTRMLPREREREGEDLRSPRPAPSLAGRDSCDAASLSRRMIAPQRSVSAPPPRRS